MSILALLPIDAHANDAQAPPNDGFELTWSAPAGCPDESALRTEVEHILGTSLRHHTRGRMVVRGTVLPSEADHSWVVDLEIAHTSAENPSDMRTSNRSIRAATCEEVSGAAALVLAILIDPDAVARPLPASPHGPSLPSGSSFGPGDAGPSRPDVPSGNPESSPRQSPSTSAQPGPSPLQPDSRTIGGAADGMSRFSDGASGYAAAPSQARSEASTENATVTAPAITASETGAAPTQPPRRVKSDQPRVWHVGAQVGLNGGYLPSWSPGIGLEAGREWHRLRATVGGLIWAPSTKTIEAQADERAHFRLYTGYAQLCVPVAVRAWTVGPCGGIELVLLHGTSEGPGINPKPQNATMASALAGGFVRWSMPPRLSLFTTLDAFVPAVRPPNFVLNAGTDSAWVHQPASVGLRITMGAEIWL